MDMRWGVFICNPHSAKCFSFSLRDLNMLAGIYIGCFIQSISHTYYNEFQSVWYEFTNGNDKKTKNVKVIQRKAKIIFCHSASILQIETMLFWNSLHTNYRWAFTAWFYWMVLFLMLVILFQKNYFITQSKLKQFFGAMMTVIKSMSSNGPRIYLISAFLYEMEYLTISSVIQKRTSWSKWYVILPTNAQSYIDRLG